MNKTFSTLATAAAVLAAAGAAAQTAPAAMPAAKATSTAHIAAPFMVKGFRSAHFGMTEDEVRAAIAQDFKPADGAVTAFDNPAEKTRVVAMHLQSLEPAPGQVNITYILGATTHKLIHVNVVWSTGDSPTEQERAQMAAGGVQLSAYFREQVWKPGTTSAGLTQGAPVFVMFAGVDPARAAVELRATGVVILLPDGRKIPGTGPAQLRLAYFDNVGGTDRAEVPKGTF